MAKTKSSKPLRKTVPAAQFERATYLLAAALDHMYADPRLHDIAHTSRLLARRALDILDPEGDAMLKVLADNKKEVFNG